ncbi:MAG: protein TolR [Rickettsiales bacterium]|nr:MAG: protein TolR [Rickettsiales bacterium]
MKMTRAKINYLLRRQKVNNIDYVLPLFSVLFLILSIVFISTTYNTIGGMKVNIPMGKAEIIVVKEEPITVTLKNDGSLYLGTNLIKISILGEKLEQMTNSNKNTKIFVIADRSIEYSKVVEIVGLIYQNGYKEVSLVTSVTKI